MLRGLELIVCVCWDLRFQVTEVNKRWQKHHSEREVYLQKLQTTIEELQRHGVAKETQVGSNKVFAKAHKAFNNLLLLCQKREIHTH